MSTKQYYLAYINDAFEKLAKSDFEIFRQSGLDPYSGAPMKYPEIKDTSKILSKAVGSASKGSSGGAQSGQARGGSFLDIMKGGGGISSTPRKPEGRYQKTLKRVWQHSNPIKDAVFPGAKVKLNSALLKVAQGGHPLTLHASSYGAYKLPKGSNGQPDIYGKPIKVKDSWVNKAQSGALSAAAKAIKPPKPTSPTQVRGGSYLTMLSKAGSVDAVKTANLALLGRGLKAAVRAGSTGLRQVPQAAGKGLQEGFKRGRTGIKAPVTTWGNARGANFAARAGRSYGRMGGMAARLVNSRAGAAAAGGALGWEAKKAWDKNRLTDRLKAAKGAFLKSPKAKGGLGGKTTPPGGTMPYREYYPTPQINRQNLTPRMKEGLKNDRWSI